MWFKNYDITLEDVSNYAPSGVNWRNHFKGFFQYQTWDDLTETAWVFRFGKRRIMLVKEKPGATTAVEAKKAKLDKAA